MPLPDIVSWQRHPEAESFIREAWTEFAEVAAPVRPLEADLLALAGVRLADILDYLALADGEGLRSRLADMGFEKLNVYAERGDTPYAHPGAALPPLLLRSGTGEPPGTAVEAAMRVEDASTFLMTHGIVSRLDGTPLCPYRGARVVRVAGRKLFAVERRGHRGLVAVGKPSDYPRTYLGTLERWKTRQRHFEDPREGLEQTLSLVRSLVDEMRPDTAAWIVFEAERDYWVRRNRAGRAQYARQQGVGLGWANLDHHTFRSSRETFAALIQTLETLGFEERERFYAGQEAGWGAQVMQHPGTGLVVFADVDLLPEEVTTDFAHQPLPPRQELGTVGLWCALHGDSILDGGLHHVAVRVDFDAAGEGLADWGIERMRPFSDLPYLRQAFTRGERWAVAPERLQALFAAGQIDDAQRQRFAADGAIGSHLETIERNEGFKGFNQASVTDIIRRTDPRSG